MQAIIEAAKAEDYPADVALVISNKTDAPALDAAQGAGIETRAIPSADFADRETFDRRVSEEIEAADCDLVVLAGFMRLLSPWFCDRWQDRLVNIHPSLLPAFKGLDVHARMIESGVRIGGCTVHFVRSEMDTGPIIVQAAVPVHPADDADALAARILVEEHRIYPMAVRWISEGRVRVVDGCVRIEGAKAADQSLINYQG